MKKTVLLAVITLLGSIAMSCDNESVGDNSSSDSYADGGFSTDDGFVPPIPPPPPPPPPVKTK